LFRISTLAHLSSHFSSRPCARMRAPYACICRRAVGARRARPVQNSARTWWQRMPGFRRRCCRACSHDVGLAGTTSVHAPDSLAGALSRKLGAAGEARLGRAGGEPSPRARARTAARPRCAGAAPCRTSPPPPRAAAPPPHTASVRARAWRQRSCPSWAAAPVITLPTSCCLSGLPVREHMVLHI